MLLAYTLSAILTSLISKYVLAACVRLLISTLLITWSA